MRDWHRSGLLEVVGPLGVEQLAHRRDERVVTRQRRVLLDQSACFLTRRGDDRLVAQQPEQPEARPPTRLGDTEDITLAALLEVEARELEAVESGRDTVDPAAGGRAELRLRDQQTQAPVASP